MSSSSPRAVVETVGTWLLEAVAGTSVDTAVADGIVTYSLSGSSSLVNGIGAPAVAAFPGKDVSAFVCDATESGPGGSDMSTRAFACDCVACLSEGTGEDPGDGLADVGALVLDGSKPSAFSSSSMSSTSCARLGTYPSEPLGPWPASPGAVNTKPDAGVPEATTASYNDVSLASSSSPEFTRSVNRDAALPAPAPAQVPTCARPGDAMTSASSSLPSPSIPKDSAALVTVVTAAAAASRLDFCSCTAEYEAILESLNFQRNMLVKGCSPPSGAIPCDGPRHPRIWTAAPALHRCHQPARHAQRALAS
jgi:hypothetical protein